MKKLSMILAILAVSLMLTGVAFAENGGFYGSIKAGGSFLDATKSTSTNSTDATGSSSKFKDDSGYALGAAVGYNWMDMDMPIRTELEYMYHSDFKFQAEDSNSTLTDKINLQTLMLNAYWDFYNSTAFTPYINGGVGFAWVKEKFSTTAGTAALTAPDDHTTTNFAFNLGAGVGWSITDSVIMDLAYRYNHYGNGKKVTAGLATEAVRKTSQVKNISTHDVLLGLRYQY